MNTRGNAAPPKPHVKAEPKYVIQKDPEPEPEKKSGLLGGLKSILNKKT
jgi:hypothetical protein